MQGRTAYPLIPYLVGQHPKYPLWVQVWEVEGYEAGSPYVVVATSLN